jgi:glycosyltransferase involved in cell wall biosynthesis
LVLSRGANEFVADATSPLKDRLIFHPDRTLPEENIQNMTQSRRTVFLYPTRSRLERLGGVKTGETPKEFYYGYLGLNDQGCNVSMVDSRADPKSFAARIKLELDVRVSGITNMGLAPQRIAAIASELDSTDIAMSFTDSFSLSLGLYGYYLPRRPRLVGGFHGLADFPDRTPSWLRAHAVRKIRKALAGLDHLFFFGEADRLESIRRYGLNPDKTSLFLFGVDTDFWTPGPSALGKSKFVLSVGSDPKRDYKTLLSSEIPAPIKIVTRLRLGDLANQPNVEMIHGSYHNIAVTDLVLRDLYRAADIVVVPVKDVFQPSGYSVTLQSMACGKPVVLSRFKGLWDPEVFKSGENCILVEPENPKVLRDSIIQLLQNPRLCARIGTGARETATTHFLLERMNRSLTDTLERVSITDPHR